MDQRKETILGLTVEQYIKTAEPIGSKFLVSIGRLHVSDATVRNEMRELEEAGYLTHPHTSAGRVPTEAGYRYYVETIMQPEKPAAETREAIERIVQAKEDQNKKTKRFGQTIAKHTQTAVIIAFSTDFVYYTGIANLFSEPEFANIVRTVNMSSVFDHCEDHVGELFDLTTKEQTSVLIGSENPLGTPCSLVARQTADGGLLTILGPMRMDYGQHVGMLDYMSNLL